MSSWEAGRRSAPQEKLGKGGMQGDRGRQAVGHGWWPLWWQAAAGEDGMADLTCLLP